MRTDGDGDSSQIEDRRGESSGGGGSPLGGGLIAVLLGTLLRGRAGRGVGGLGIVGLLVVLGLQFFGSGGGRFAPDTSYGGFGTGSQRGSAANIPDAQKKLASFVTYVTTDVQGVWTQRFTAAGKTYAVTKTVLYDRATQTGCGPADSGVGPFYCPADKKVYLDLSFFTELSQRFNAPGDFAEAYVIAHEYGHHVQDLLGTSDEVATQSERHPDQKNELSVRLELQADCYAGIWAHDAYSAGELEDGDLAEALGAASAVGDDTLQQQAGRTVNPDSFTHGTSQQRTAWLRTGYDSGDLGKCDTFRASEL